MVEQGREHTRRVEARTTEPVDRAIRRDQRSGLEVADDGVILDAWVAHNTALLASERLVGLRIDTRNANEIPSSPRAGEAAALSGVNLRLPLGRNAIVVAQ